MAGSEEELFDYLDNKYRILQDFIKKVFNTEEIFLRNPEDFNMDGVVIEVRQKGAKTAFITLVEEKEKYNDIKR